MKKIGIDARLYGQTGVGVYIRNLLHNLVQLENNDFEYFVYAMPADIESLHNLSKQMHIRNVTSRWHSFAEQTTFYRQLQKDDLDLMHFTYFSYPVLYTRPFIATVHDLIPLLFKTGKASTKHKLIFNTKHAAYKYVLERQVVNAKAVITPTQTVKDEIVKFYGEKYSKKIFPFYEGVDYTLQSQKVDSSISSQVPASYFLYIGNFYPHKNIENLIKAFAEVSGETNLVLVGPEDFFTEHIRTKIKEYGQTSRIKIITGVNDGQKLYLYQHADALVHPALSEGFGLPLIEAAYCGKPILASRIPVFEELWQDSYISFDPLNTKDISKKLMSFIEKKPQFDYSTLLKKYSFVEMSRQIVDLYHKL